MSEVVFEVTQEEDGTFSAQSVGEGYGIFTQGDTWDELGAMAVDAVRCHFEDALPATIRLHLVKEDVLHLDEAIPAAA